TAASPPRPGPAIPRDGSSSRRSADRRCPCRLACGPNVAQNARMARFLYQLCCGALLGAQLFFAVVGAQVAFPREVAALPRDDPRRQLAADLVGAMLSRLDAATIAGAGVAVVCAILVGRWNAAIAP